MKVNEFGKVEKNISKPSNFSLIDNIMEELTKDIELDDLCKDTMSNIIEFNEKVSNKVEKEELISKMADICASFRKIEWKLNVSENYVNSITDDKLIKQLNILK